MALSDQVVSAAEIAEALQYAPDYFLRIVPDLIQNHGMPCRLPSSHVRHTWSRKAIEHWLSTYHETASRRVAHPGREQELPSDIVEHRQALRLAYTREGAPA